MRDKKQTEKGVSKSKAAARKQGGRSQQTTAASSKAASSPNARVSRCNKNGTRTPRRENTRVSTQNPRRIQPPPAFYRYVIAVTCVALGVVLFLMLLTFSQADLLPDAERCLNLFGFVGAHIADIMLMLFGLSAFLFPGVCLLIGICTFFGKNYEVKASEFIGVCLAIVGSAPLLDLAVSSNVLDHRAGGVFGEQIAKIAGAWLPLPAMISVGIFFVIFGLLLTTDTRVKTFLAAVWRVIAWVVKTLTQAFARPFRKAAPETDGNVCETADSVCEHGGETAAPYEGNDIYYEDSPSQLLDGVSNELEEREAIALKNCQPTGAASGSENDPSEPDFQEQVPSDDGAEHWDAQEMEPSGGDCSDALEEAQNGDEPLTEAEHATPEAALDERDRATDILPKEEPLEAIMAKIKRNAPKSRNIKRSHSVPALEPEFEFDSIVAPEQIPQAGNTAASAPVPRQAILPNWKPRSVPRAIRKVEHVPENMADHATDDTLALEGGSWAASLPEAAKNVQPSCVTRDLLDQLASDEGDESWSALNLGASSWKAEKKAPLPRVTMPVDLDEIFHENKDILRNSNVMLTVNPGVESADFPDISENAIVKDGLVPAPSRNRTHEADMQQSQKLDKTSDVTKVPLAAELDLLVAKASPDYVIRQNLSESLKRSLILDAGLRSDPEAKSSGSETPRAAYHLNDLEQAQINHRRETQARVVSEENAVIEETQARPEPEPFRVEEEKKLPSEKELNEAERKRQQQSTPDYRIPPAELLNYDPNVEKGLDHEAMAFYANRIKEKLEEYKVRGEVVNVCPGPVVTRFEFMPAPGTKVATIESLAKDLMMALEIVSIRIQAPIPGKNVVGIEIPNEKRNTIYFKEVILSDQFQNAKSILTLGLGKDSEGVPIVSDLAKMPHLLVAGTTGSGKSVGINTMLCSLLFRATPSQLQLILVDPKMLELSVYDGIPHLLVPPITTPREAASALAWACDEMDGRYRKLTAFGVRNIAEYNAQLANPTLPSALKHIDELNEDGAKKYQTMPYMVIVVDEFADLMMVSGKEIENSIVRLAQKARAAGIHLILATQRPSRDVVTGLIKANFPTRLAFKVSSGMESSIILNQKGAETLLGNGDALFLSPHGELTRVHGAFVSDLEVQKIVKFLSDQNKSEYHYDILTYGEDNDDGKSSTVSVKAGDKLDDMYDAAVQVVIEAGQASASLLQRRLGIGFNRGARLIEQMEREGVIGPPRGQKPREVLVGRL